MEEKEDGISSDNGSESPRQSHNDSDEYTQPTRLTQSQPIMGEESRRRTARVPRPVVNQDFVSSDQIASAVFLFALCGCGSDCRLV